MRSRNLEQVPRRKARCYAKLIVNYKDKERIIGFHYMGPNAGEVTQVESSYTEVFSVLYDSEWVSLEHPLPLHNPSVEPTNPESIINPPPKPLNHKS